MTDFNINTIHIENKTIEHYIFLLRTFESIYINIDNFLKRDDLNVYCLRNEKGKLIAISLCRISHTKKKSTLITRIMFVSIDKQYKGNGINYYLNNYIQMECIKYGCKKMVCNIKTNNISSIISFLKSGFIITKMGIPYKDGTKKLFLEKKI